MSQDKFKSLIDLGPPFLLNPERKDSTMNLMKDSLTSKSLNLELNNLVSFELPFWLLSQFYIVHILKRGIY